MDVGPVKPINRVSALVIMKQTLHIVKTAGAWCLVPGAWYLIVSKSTYYYQSPITPITNHPPEQENLIPASTTLLGTYLEAAEKPRFRG